MFDARRLDDLLEPLYAAVLDLSALDIFNQRLAEATDSHITGVMMHDVMGGKAQVNRIHGFDNARMASLLTEVDLRDDPWMRLVTPRLTIGKVMSTEDVLARKEALHSGFYNTYYRELGIVEQVASVGLHDGTNSVTLSICHGNPQRVYGASELGLLHALTPHWINAYAMLRRMGQLERHAASLEQALERSPVAMFILGDDLRICRVNASGEHLLERGLLKRDAGFLVGRNATGTCLQGMLRRTLLGHLRMTGGDVERLVLNDDGGQPCLVVTAHRLSDWPGRERGALLVFAREVQQASMSLGPVLQSLFGLTESESRLALTLYRHADAGAAARECGITAGTALGRLKTIYDKTGVRGQASLLRLVAAVAGTGDS